MVRLGTTFPLTKNSQRQLIVYCLVSILLESAVYIIVDGVEFGENENENDEMWIRNSFDEDGVRTSQSNMIKGRYQEGERTGR